MSLYKQLSLLILSLFLLIFAGSYWLNFSSTQAFLNRQMQSQVQDAATSLGLTLVPYLMEDNISGVETTVNALFDRGFYQEIVVYNYDDEEIVSREQGVQIGEVPAWFVGLIELAAPRAEQELSAGWALAGRVVVSSNPGYAYQQLWRSMTNSLSAYLAIFLLLLVGGFFALQRLMQPLQALVLQARAICNRQYDFTLPVPKVPELATVVLAMNQMAASVKATFTELSNSVSQLREQAFQDPVTGLGNKRFFQTQLQSLIEEVEAGQEREFTPGSLFLIQLNDFKGFNARAGYKRGDALLADVADSLKRSTARHEVLALSRLNGGDFAFFLADDNEAAADALADQLANALMGLAKSAQFEGPDLAKIGIATIHKALPYGAALSRADSALRLAQSKSSTTWIRASELDSSELHAMSRQEWNDYIRQCIEQGQLALLAQNVVSSQAAGELLHREVFLQLQDKTGQGIPAGRFMATSNELGLSTEVDKQVITCLAERLAKGQETARFAINLSSQSVEDEAFMAWLKQLLQSVPAKTVASRLVFELNEADVIRQLDKTRAFASEIRALGCGLGIDQFGKTFADFAFLNSLRPDYVKIDRIYSHELREDADAGFFISSLCGICRSLDIAVIAQAIETAEQGDMLRQAGVAGLQGYAIEKPGILDSDPGK